jgi:TrpR family trp operon transcriptional repressor
MKSGWINELSQVLTDIDTVRDMTEFLKGLLTEGEIDELARRVQIVKRLKAGVAHHAIAKELGVGVATVTRGSKEIQKGRFIQIH